MPRSKQEQGERERYEARYRLSIGFCTGWDDSHDPSTLPDTSLVTLINGRVHDGIVLSRGGQELASDHTLNDECIYGMIEAEGGDRFFLNPLDVGGAGMLDVYQETQATPYVRISTDDNETGIDNARLSECSVVGITAPRYIFEKFQGKMIMSSELGSDDGGFPAIHEIVVPEGATSVDATEIKIRTLVNLTGIDEPSSLHVIPGFPDTLYIGTVGGEVWKYFGGSLIDISPGTPLPSERVLLFSIMGTLYAVCGYNVAYYTGASWVALSFPVAVTDFLPTCVKEFGGLGYIGGNSDTGDVDGGIILIITPGSTTMTEGVVYRPGLFRCENITDFGEYQGALYYGWQGYENVTQFSYLVEYNTTNVYQVSTEDTTLIARLYNSNGRLFMGIGSGGSVAKLSEFRTPNIVDLIDTFTLLDDSHGAHDMVAF